MRLNFTLPILSYTLAGVISAASPAVADWHSPYIYRETSGTWTNVQYDDGVCTTTTTRIIPTTTTRASTNRATARA